MAHGLSIRNGKLSLSQAAVVANREHDRRQAAGLDCSACGSAFGSFNRNQNGIVKRDARLKDCCEVCARDFE